MKYCLPDAKLDQQDPLEQVVSIRRAISLAHDVRWIPMNANDIQQRIWGTVLKRSDLVITREIAEETLVVPIRAQLAQLQRIFALNPVAAFIWELIDGHTDLASVLSSVIQSFEVEDEEARQDVLSFVSLLADAELVVGFEKNNPFDESAIG